MENQDAFVVDDSDENGFSAQAEWADSDDDATASEPAEKPGSKEPIRVNLAARRAIEDYQERKRLRQLLGDEYLDL